MPVNIKGLQVAALLDAGSSINIISKSLFDILPNNGKFNFGQAVSRQSNWPIINTSCLTRTQWCEDNNAAVV